MSDAALSFRNQMIKRGLDIVVSLAGLLFLGWVIVIASVVARWDTGKSGFFLQERVGKDGRIFKVIKIRTMRDIPGVETSVTCVDDPRITRIGMFFRKYKIDELPQLINVLIGDMSLVGPRPDVPGYADKLQGRDRMILSIRPGITGPSTLKYRDEEVLLSEVSDPKKYNDEVIFPDKVRLNREYIENYSFFLDLYYLYRTFFPKKVKNNGC